MRRVPTTPVKRPYQPPKFISYGDLTQMTKARLKGTGMLDMVGGMRKT
jgi:hypothetical protein